MYSSSLAPLLVCPSVCLLVCLSGCLCVVYIYNVHAIVKSFQVRRRAGHALTTRPLPKMLFFFFKKCFWHCSLSSQKMLKISRDSLKNALSHFLSRLKTNKQMIKDQDTGMGGGEACYPISGKGKRTRPYYTSNIKESEHTTTTTTLPALFSRN